MLPAKLLQLAVAFAVSALAQTSTTATNPSSTSSTAVATYTIDVGANGFVYTPNQVNASVGSIIEFSFYPGGHTVVRSDFGQPCIPYEDSGLNRVGFFSGNISPQIVTSDLPKFSVRVNDTNPIFFYCSAPGSCYQQHMIGVINPSANETFDKQLDYAMNATFQLAPGDPFPSESATTAAPTATSTSTGSTSTAVPDSGNGGGSSGLGPGPIAGIAIGSAAVVLLAAALIYLCGRRGGIDKGYRRSIMTFPPPMVEAKFNPKSPAQATFTSQYSMPPEQDPYRGQNQSPPMQQFVQSPGPLSPGSQPTYNTYPTTVQPGQHSPLMGDMQSQQQGYYPGQITPSPDHINYAQHQSAPVQSQSTPPVELPTSENPGHSPLPQYQPARQFSWAQGAEGSYRPSSKA